MFAQFEDDAIVATFSRPQPDFENVQEIDDADPRIATFLQKQDASLNTPSPPPTLAELQAQLAALAAQIAALSNA